MVKTQTSAREASQQDKLTRHEKGTGPEQSSESAKEEAGIGKERSNRQNAKAHTTARHPASTPVPDSPGAHESTKKIVRHNQPDHVSKSKHESNKTPPTRDQPENGNSERKRNQNPDGSV